jgi:hypothetical protein
MAWSKHKNINFFQPAGTVTLNGTTGVAVTSTVPIGPNSIIILTLKTAAGTQTGHPYLSATPTTGPVGTAAFTVKGTGASDTSVYNYTIIG